MDSSVMINFFVGLMKSVGALIADTSSPYFYFYVVILMTGVVGMFMTIFRSSR